MEWPSWSWSYGSWIYNQRLSPLTLWFRTPLRWGVLDTTLYDKVCQWLATGRWFSPGTLTYLAWYRHFNKNVVGIRQFYGPKPPLLVKRCAHCKCIPHVRKHCCKTNKTKCVQFLPSKRIKARRSTPINQNSCYTCNIIYAGKRHRVIFM